jgi:predicted TPR repeat methyltransferase
VPQAPPRGHVQGLFDDYAGQFDAHLLQVLHYRGHQVLVEELRRAAGARRFEHALDLGCGTGLAGEPLRALAVRLDGVDIAANMLEQARAKHVYDRLEQADAVSYLASTDQRYDLVAAADVFTYLGALDEVFAGVARVLRSGGLFAFSAEVADDDGDADIVLRASLRYAHARRYLERLAREHGFTVLSLQRRPFREDRQVMLRAWYGVLSR